jgi:tetratricopeptide (TPR) repeat protein
LNVSEYISIINNPIAVQEAQTVALEKIIAEFPYFQSARATRLKGLHSQKSFRYNFDLKITAAHTTDRTVLFDFITSEVFINEEEQVPTTKPIAIEALEVVAFDVVPPVETKQEAPLVDKLEQSILTSIKESTSVTTKEKPVLAEFEKKETENTLEQSIISSIKEAETNVKTETPIEVTPVEAAAHLEIGQPLDFSKSEKHSFQEWLQLAKLKPIERDENSAKQIEETPEKEIEKQKKTELINKFIASNPKIPPIKQDYTPKATVEPVTENNSYFMTETLARVYLEQKKYQKAIQAYEILILKYPEKSSFFANRISDIKILQHNNNK